MGQTQSPHSFSLLEIFKSQFSVQLILRRALIVPVIASYSCYGYIALIQFYLKLMFGLLVPDNISIVKMRSYVCIYVCMSIFAITEQQKFIVIFNTLK